MWHRRLPPGSSGAEAWEPRTSSRSVSATGLRLQSSVPFRNTMSLLDEKDRPCFVRQSPDSASWKFFPKKKKKERDEEERSRGGSRQRRNCVQPNSVFEKKEGNHDAPCRSWRRRS